MRKILILVAVIAATCTMNAHNNDVLKDFQWRGYDINATSIKATAIPIFNDISLNVKSSDDALFGNYGSDSNRFFIAQPSGGGGAEQLDDIWQTPVAYEPYTNRLYTISINVYRPDVNNIDSIGEQTIISYSDDIGKTWHARSIFNSFYSQKQPTFARRYYPSICVSNPKKTNDTNDILIGYRAFKVNYYSNPQTDVTYNALIGFTGNQRMLQFPNTEVNRRTTETDLYEAWTGAVDPSNTFYTLHALAAATDDGKTHAFFYGSTFAANASAKKHYSIIDVDMTDANTGNADDMMLNGGIARNLGEIDKNLPYKIAEAFDYDDAGNVYIMSIAPTTYLSTLERLKPLPIVFKAKISDLANEDAFAATPDTMSIDAISEYVVSQGGIPDMNFWIISSPQNQASSLGDRTNTLANYSFVVTGENEYSIVAPFQYAKVNAPGDTSNVFTISEFSKSGGKWTIREISRMNFPSWIDDESLGSIMAPFLCRLDVSKSEANPDIYIETNCNEIGLARTADRQYIVTKFIMCDTNSALINFSKPIPFKFVYTTTDDNGRKDSVTLTATKNTFPYAEEWIAYRKVSENNWTLHKALSCDTINARHTAMPKIIPNINNVPLFFSFCKDLPVASANTDIGKYLLSLPKAVRSSIYTTFIQYGYLMVADATMDNTYYSSIRDNGASETFSLNSVYPNPASSGITFDFSLLSPAYTTLTIHNSLGQPVAEVVNSFLEARNWAISYNVESLPAGTYYYTLKSGTKAETKMFTIVK